MRELSWIVVLVSDTPSPDILGIPDTPESGLNELLSMFGGGQCAFTATVGRPTVTQVHDNTAVGECREV